jgi:hypothetical protein
MRLHVLVAAVAICSCSCNYMRHPTSATTWGKPVGTMVLGLEARGDVVNAFIENRGVRPQRVIAKGITLTLERQGGGSGSGGGEVTKIMDAPVIQLDREETFDVIPPRQHMASPISITKLPPGTYTVTATYGERLPAQAGDWWIGSLTAGPITLVIP